jgi:hypothetical protein
MQLVLKLMSNPEVAAGLEKRLLEGLRLGVIYKVKLSL